MLLRLSRKGDYGIILVCALAQNSKGKLISLAKIANEYNLPQKFVARLASALKNSGILKAKEGVRGGYMLARSPQNISLLEVLEALEGPLVGEACCSQGSCRIEAVCPSKGAWAKIADELSLSLAKKTLADLLPKKASGPGGPLARRGGGKYGRHPDYL